MKQKKQNRILAALLAVAMMFQMLPMMAFAAEETAPAAGKAKIGETEYNSVMEAVKAAPANGSTTTITLGEGEYTLYGIPSDDTTKNKNLTFVGQGAGLTTWKIGCPDSDQKSMYNADFSFENSKTITFQDMTLKVGTSYDYQGFAHTDTTVVENCVIEGKTFFWGYQSATFKDTVFKAPVLDYAIWVYSSAKETFDGCTFDATGKVIYIYNEGTTPKMDVTFKDCKVNSSAFAFGKAALNINDTFASQYTVRITDNDIKATTDKISCSKIFGFSGRASNNNGHTDVYLNGELVWKNGEMQTHAYTDGEKDKAYNITYSSSNPNGWVEEDGHYKRHVIKTCNYCGYKEEKDEIGYQLSYNLNGGAEPADAAADEYATKLRGTSDALAKAPVLEGYRFLGWKSNEDSSVYPAGTKLSEITDLPQTGDITLTAQWEEITTPDGGSSGDGGSGDGGAGVVVAGALLGGAGYLLGTRLWLESTFGFVPANRIELAMALWKRADCPAPVSTELYPDIDEDDTDAQAAARWCVEQDLMKDFARTNSDGTQTVKFKPYDYVFRPQSLVKWYKLEKLLNEQQSTNA